MYTTSQVPLVIFPYVKFLIILDRYATPSASPLQSNVTANLCLHNAYSDMFSSLFVVPTGKSTLSRQWILYTSELVLSYCLSEIAPHLYELNMTTNLAFETKRRRIPEPYFTGTAAAG